MLYISYREIFLQLQFASNLSIDTSTPVCHVSVERSKLLPAPCFCVEKRKGESPPPSMDLGEDISFPNVLLVHLPGADQASGFSLQKVKMTDTLLCNLRDFMCCSYFGFYDPSAQVYFLRAHPSVLS
jgi:hypothetical protein